MKTTKAILATMVAMTGLTLNLSAATVLIDSSTNNGSFEQGTGNTPTAWVTYPGKTTLNRNGPYSTYVTPDGNYSLVMGKNGNNVFYGVAVDTSYTLTGGDNLSFDLSLWSIGASGFTSGGTVTWSLVYSSNDTINGTLTTLASGNITIAPTGTDWQQATQSIANVAVSEDANGKDLFFVLNTTSANTNTYCRVDDIQLSLIPEPASYLLLLSGLGLVALLRRQKTA